MRNSQNFSYNSRDFLHVVSVKLSQDIGTHTCSEIYTIESALHSISEAYSLLLVKHCLVIFTPQHELTNLWSYM